jgi:DNA-binding SARP family transcriptional activator/tetratricopeptide (TPR) repeat protein
MKVRVLGPVEAIDHGRAVALGRRRERFVFGLLALRAGHWVSAADLSSALFGDAEPPAKTRAAFQVSVARLRRALAAYGELIHGRGGGLAYLLDIPSTWVDAEEFRLLAAEGIGVTDPAIRAEVLTAALALWRGGILQDVVDPREPPALAEELNTLRARVTELRIAAEIEAGRHAEAAVTLGPLVRASPTNEVLAGLYMTALHRSGRSADALAAYATARRIIGDEYGAEPAAALTELHVRILRGEADPPTVAASGVAVPDMLPRAVPDFVGRRDAVSRLDAVARTDGVPIVVVAAAGGTGKTALAVHWSRTRADTYPDGRLFVDLRGFGPRRPLVPIEALSILLRALGVAPEAIPVDEDAASALLRARLTGKRALLVLDNAASAAQVRPLIPAADGCLVLVTSRDRLTGLTMSHSAIGLGLPRLSRPEAIAVLRGVIGNARVARQPEAADDIATLCDGLPLALRIAAAIIDAHPELALDQYVRETRAQVLDSLEIAGDVNSGLRAVLGYSYQSLSAALRELFTLLSISAGPDTTVPAVVALTGLPEAMVRARLEELSAVHLLEQRAFGRYSMHALTRAFATELLALQPDSRPATVARARLLGYYVHTADNASIAGADAKLKLPRDPVPAGVHPSAFTDAQPAHAWFRQELPNLLAEAVNAAAVGPLPVAWQLADALHTYFWTNRDAAPWTVALTAGADAATRAGNDEVLANMLVRRGSLHWAFSENAAAEQIYAHALEVNERIGRRLGIAGVHQSLAALYYETGRLPEAKRSNELALEIYRDLGRRDQQAFVLAISGYVACALGDVDGAIEFSRLAADLHREMGMKHALASALCLEAACQMDRTPPDLTTAQRLAEEALAASEAMDSRIGIAEAHSTLALVAAHAGCHAEAGAHADTAVAVATATQHRVSECFALLGRGEARVLAGDPADDDFAAALALAHELAYPQAQVRALIGLARSTDNPSTHLEAASAISDRHGLRGLQKKISAAAATIALRSI